MSNQQQQFQLNDPKVINAWAMFDWANSVYYLIIATAIFPVYFTNVVEDKVTLLGMEFSDTSLLAFCITIVYVILAFLSPILSGIADYGGQKKTFLKIFTTFGALACIGLWGFQSMNTLWIGVLCFIIATIGAAGGLVFYNAFLPEIVSEDKYDSVSARGFAFGYIGSVILLIINLIMIEGYEIFGFADKGSATRIAFVTVGLWWIGFAQITIRRLPSSGVEKPILSIIGKGIDAFLNVWNDLKTQGNLKNFLLSFLFYNAGVQTVIYMATVFADKELHFQTADLIILVLLIQLLGAIGAYFFAWLSNKYNNKKALIVTLATWALVCVAASFVVDKTQFYLLGVFVGLVLGGAQSLSRASYAKIIPQNTPNTTSYFSFFDVVEKCSIVIGTFSFGFIENLTGSMRMSALTLGIFFIIGILLLWKVSFRSSKANNS
jgi:MFS transporter, UMF1 family